MRTRRFANNERIRSKERRLLEALRRRESARSLSVLPKGILGSLSHTTSGTTSTINTPLLALVETAAEDWQVDFATVPDATGGFENVAIEAGKQIAELDEAEVLSFTGQALGTYVVYAQHTLTSENSESRNPPTKYAGGTGVFTEHAAFFGHGQPAGAPIPREGYDSTLSAESVSEAVDRLTIAYALEASVPANATQLIRVVWNGTSISSSTVLAQTINFADLYTHIGARGTAHAVATVSEAGFMSATDKALLDTAQTGVGAFTIMRRSGVGRVQVADPAVSADAATKNYVDTATVAASLATGAQNMRFLYGAVEEAGAGAGLPTGWSSVRLSTGIYRLTTPRARTNYIMLSVLPIWAGASYVGGYAHPIGSGLDNSIDLYARDLDGLLTNRSLRFLAIEIN